MKISDLLSPSDVLVNTPASNKQLLLQGLASEAANSLGLRVDQVTPLLLRREQFGSTGIGRGVAIPHALLPDLQRPFGLMAKLKQPVEFDAIDDQAVDLVFLLLLPAKTEHGQLCALALVARALRQIDVLDRLRRARDASEIYSVMAAASPT
jgi:PTS system nitrogen regulatory IIA component